jgi:iron(III) transport system substrate-binding protein
MLRFVCVSLLTCLLSSMAWAREAITVYTALENEQIKPLLAMFAQAHPEIEVNLVRDSTGVITARFLAEASNPRADVIWQLAATSLLIAEERNLLEPHAPAELDLIDPRFRDSANPPVWVGGNAWLTAFAVNKLELQSQGLAIPRSFDDLTKPEYRGMIVMSNPASSGTGFLTVSAILQLFGEEKGWEYLQRLHRNIASYEHSGSKPAKMAASGEAVIGVSFCYASLQQLRRGAPVEVVFPTEGSGWELEATALVRKPRIKPEARTFIDWATGREAITQYGQAYGVVARPDVKADDTGYPADVASRMISNDLRWAASNRDRILAEWNRRFASGK